MSQPLVDQLRAWGQDPNVRHFLDVVIPGAEGTTQHGYNTAFGGGRFDDLTDHPRYLKPFKQTDGKQNYTSAAGKYQFIQPTWDDAKGKLGLTDFSPENQDLAALYLLQQNGALPHLLQGDFNTAIQKSGKTWASLPSSPYAQPKRSDGFIAGLVNKMIPAAQAGTLPQQPQTNATPPTAPARGNNMDTNQPSGIPMQMNPVAAYQALLAQQNNAPVQALTPEQKEALLAGRQQRAAMLPMAIAASLAGDKRISALGNQMYQDARQAQGSMQLGDEGWLTSSGDLIQNPFMAAKRDDARKDRALALAVAMAKGQNAPPGYTWTQGQNGQPSLQYIPGGPGDPDVKKATQEPTEDEKKSAGYALRIQQGLNTIGTVTNKNPGASTPEIIPNVVSNVPFVGQSLANTLTSSDRQQVEAAQLDMLDAALTLNTGAAYTKEQLQGLSKSYFPQIGDSDETIQDKQKRLNDLISTARMRAGRMDSKSQSLVGGGQPGAAGGAEERRIINNEVFVKRNGQWFKE